MAGARGWEQRWHPFRGEWVLFAPHRGGRPWCGEMVSEVSDPSPPYDPVCALCPGNSRLGGVNPQYQGAHWFANDLPPFGPEAPQPADIDPLYRVRSARGASEVVCYHPDHSKTFADLAVTEALAVVELWIERSLRLAAKEDVDSVLIFENKGSLVGTSNPHPHGQIYAASLVFGVLEREAEVAAAHWRQTGRTIGGDVADREGTSPRAFVDQGEFFACVPWFARYAYETLVLPRRPVSALPELTDAERRSLAATLREVTIRFDNLWSRPMPYVMAIHQAPTDGVAHPSFPFHVAFHPPLRAPNTLKYLAGPEIGGGTMTNESNPDERAGELRAASPDRRGNNPDVATI